MVNKNVVRYEKPNLSNEAKLHVVFRVPLKLSSIFSNVENRQIIKDTHTVLILQHRISQACNNHLQIAIDFIKQRN